jgi:hypothetical protein
METRPDVAAQLPALKQRLEFAYDAQGRRVEKAVYSWNLGLGTWNLETRQRFLYDGWNLLAELNASSLQPTATFVWGLRPQKRGQK